MLTMNKGYWKSKGLLQFENNLEYSQLANATIFVKAEV